MTLPLVLLLALLRADGPAREDRPFVALGFAEACARAGAEHKIVLLDFSTDWCPWCRKLDSTTWKDEAVVAWLAEHAIAIRVNGDREKALVERFAVKSYPTLVFTSADGTERARLSGYLPPKVFLERAELVLAGKPVPAEYDQPDPEHDPMKREWAGDLLMQTGRYAEALEQYLWCWDEGEVWEDSYGGVRRSFLLGNLVQLGFRYPPAREAIGVRRARAVEQLRKGEGTWDTVHDVCSIDQVLNQRRKSLELLDAIKDDDLLGSRIREDLAKALVDLLVEDRRYADVVRWIPDIPRWLSITLAPLPKLKDEPGLLGLLAPLEDRTFAELRRKDLEEAGVFYEALLGSNRFADATRAAGEITGADAQPETHLILARHAWRAGKHELAQDHADHALEAASTPAERARIAKQWREFLQPSAKVWWPLR